MNNIYKVLLAFVVFFTCDYAVSDLLKEGLNRGFGLNQESEIFVVGHSHMMMGVNKERLEKGLKCKVSKYTRTGVSLPERYLMTQQYIDSKYSKKIKVALVGVDAFTFSEGNISENCYTLFYPFYEDENVNSYLAEHAKPSEYWQHRIIRLSRYSDDLINSSMRGWLQDDKNYKTNKIDMNEFARQRNKWKSTISFNKELMRKLNDLITMLTERGVKVYLVNTPTIDVINHVQPENYKRIMEYYRKLADDDMVYFIDFTKYESNHELFFDPLHLNVQGQILVTDSLIRCLSTKQH